MALKRAVHACKGWDSLLISGADADADAVAIAGADAGVGFDADADADAGAGAGAGSQIGAAGGGQARAVVTVQVTAAFALQLLLNVTPSVRHFNCTVANPRGACVLFSRVCGFGRLTCFVVLGVQLRRA